MSDISSHVEDALGSGSRVVAYMIGQKYPRFAGCSRELLAQVFEGHGYPHAAKQLRDGAEARRCLQAAISRRGKSRANQLARRLTNGGPDKVDVAVLPLEAADSDVLSFGVYVMRRQPGERKAEPAIGARVYASPDGTIRAAAPVDAPENADCRALAEQFASEAQALLTVCEVSDVSAALTDAYGAAAAYPFLAKGLYLVHDNPDGRQLVSLVNAVRAQFYDENARAGVRPRAVKVTEADRAAVSDAVVDDIERKAAELAEQLRDYAARDKGPGKGTLSKRRGEAAELIKQINAQRELIGQWSERFAAQADSLRVAFDRAVNGMVLELPDWARDAQPASSPVAAPAPEPAPAPAPAPAAPIAASPVVSVAPCKPIGEPAPAPAAPSPGCFKLD